MAAASGTEDPIVEAASAQHSTEVEQLLQTHPGRFEFFQAVRLLLRFAPRHRDAGRFINPEDEAVRFETESSLAFPPNTVAAIRREADTVCMRVTFMGLTGPSGVLPRCYSALLLSRVRERDHTLANFFDIFNHRMISLFYRAWEKYRFGVCYERNAANRVSGYLACLVGLGTVGLENRLGIGDERLLSYAGLLSLQARSATALKHVLEDYFDVPVEVEQFIGVWRQLDGHDQCVFDDSKSYSGQLGVAAVVGDAVWDPQSRIRVKLGPMDRERYLHFLPSGSAWGPLRELTRFFCGPAMEVEAQLILEQNDVPRCDLGKQEAGGPRLGWFTWIRSGTAFDRPPGDTVLLLT